MGVARREHGKGLADGDFEIGREGRVFDPGADLGAGGGQGPHVLGVERCQTRIDLVGQAAVVQELPKRMGRGGEAAGHTHARGSELRDHLAQAGIFATHRIDIGHS
ncbi:hypothetical protein GALL_483470 [mine drainage metagenome]|uniref:Uncharacterized protein n=1 Tax=mine drainage metagenome TaxID=410659 RepID=A0A1J5PF88_9ZZZZ